MKTITSIAVCLLFAICIYAQNNNDVDIQNSEYKIIFPFEYDSCAVIEDTYNPYDSVLNGCIVYFKINNGSIIRIFLKYRHYQGKKSNDEYLLDFIINKKDSINSIQNRVKFRNIYDSCYNSIIEIRPNWFDSFKMDKCVNDTTQRYLVWVNQNYLYTCNSVCTEYHVHYYEYKGFECEVLISIWNVLNKNEKWIDDLFQGIQIVRK